MKKLPVHFAKPYILLSLLLLVIGSVFVYIRFSPPTIIIVDSPTEVRERSYTKPHYSRSRQKLFRFDPNTIDSSGLDSLDLPKWIKRNLLKYRSSGAVFRHKADLRKLYGMSDSLYSRIEQFVVIEGFFEQNSLPSATCVKKERTNYTINHDSVDLNSSVAASLLIPKLVGEKRCMSIIKYRERLGGFYSVSQLAEVYSIGDSLLPSVSEYYFADQSKISKRNLTDETWKTLVSHPYIDAFLAKHILQARKISPELISIRQMFDAKIIDSTAYSKLKFYFN